MIKIKYQNPENPETFLYSQIDDTSVNVDEYLKNLHRTQLCDDKNSCSGENCKIWMDIEGEYVLVGIDD